MASSGVARSFVQRTLTACQHRTSLVATTPITSSSSSSTALSAARPRITLSSAAGQARFASASVKLSGPPQPRKPPKKGPAKRRRPNRDHNKQRGLSAMRQTGPRELLSVSGLPLPRPVSEAEFFTGEGREGGAVVKTDPAHGLWDFFYERGRPLNTPSQDKEHGRAWRVEELRRKSWEDLHRLWWVCVKERNRIATGNLERKKGGYGYGDVESKEREMEVRKTQNAIKHTLTERFYAWEDARKLAREDPEIEFNENGINYVPAGQQIEEDELEWEDEMAEADQATTEAPVEIEQKAVETEHKPPQQNVDPSIPPSDVKSQHEGPRA